MKKLLLIIIAALSLTSCEDMFWNSSIRYEVYGTGTLSVTYANKSGGTNQADVASGWTYEFEDMGAEKFRYISAQSNAQNATVTVKIYSGKDLLKSATSNGSYCIATASGVW